MARALKMADKTIDRLKTDNAGLLEDVSRMGPKEIFADVVSTSHTSILIGDLAKLLKRNGAGTGQKRLFEVKESAVSNPDGSVRINRTTKVTGKGQQRFINKFLDKDEKSA